MAEPRTQPAAEVDVDEARDVHTRGSAVFLDVREPREWAQGRIAGATHLPLPEVAALAADVLPDTSRPVVAYCATGRRSLRAAATLAGLGYEHVTSLAGGIEDWFSHGYPVDVPDGAR